MTNGLASTFAPNSIAEGNTFAGLEQVVYFFRRIPADGRPMSLRAQPTTTLSEAGLLAGNIEVLDADGTVIARNYSVGFEVPAELRQKPVSSKPKRVLATLLFSDIVGSSEHATRVGDAAWSELRSRHHAAVRRALARHDGIEVDTAGDGFFARFESPARALECALEMRQEVAELGLELRIGLHTGECEQQGSSISGVAVHAAARGQATAAPGQILVSEMVKGLALGSAYTFEERGEHELKGVPGTWRLYAVSA